jgi:hypothetical protein
MLRHIQRKRKEKDYTRTHRFHQNLAAEWTDSFPPLGYDLNVMGYCKLSVASSMLQTVKVRGQTVARGPRDCVPGVRLRASVRKTIYVKTSNDGRG